MSDCLRAPAALSEETERLCAGYPSSAILLLSSSPWIHKEDEKPSRLPCVFLLKQSMSFSPTIRGQSSEGRETSESSRIQKNPSVLVPLQQRKTRKPFAPLSRDGGKRKNKTKAAREERRRIQKRREASR